MDSASHKAKPLAKLLVKTLKQKQGRPAKTLTKRDGK